MRELGEKSPELHRQTGAYAGRLCDAVIACGAEAEPIADGAGAGAVWYPDRDALIRALPGLIRAGDAVLVKASRAMGFEAVVEALKTIGI